MFTEPQFIHPPRITPTHFRHIAEALHTLCINMLSRSVVLLIGLVWGAAG
jgi:hypothetical protein